MLKRTYSNIVNKDLLAGDPSILPQSHHIWSRYKFRLRVCYEARAAEGTVRC